MSKGGWGRETACKTDGKQLSTDLAKACKLQFTVSQKKDCYTFALEDFVNSVRMSQIRSTLLSKILTDNEPTEDFYRSVQRVHADAQNP